MLILKQNRRKAWKFVILYKRIFNLTIEYIIQSTIRKETPMGVWVGSKPG